MSLVGTLHYPDYWKEVLLIPVHFIGTGEYDLNQRTIEESSETYGGVIGAIFLEEDFDVNIARYYPRSDPQNVMEIVAYDSTTGVMEGTFQVTFVIQDDWEERVKKKELNCEKSTALLRLNGDAPISSPLPRGGLE